MGALKVITTNVTVGTPHKNIGGLARVLLLVLALVLLLFLLLVIPVVLVIIQGLVLLSMFFWTRFDCILAKPTM